MMSRSPSNNYTPTPRGRSRRKNPHMTHFYIDQQVINLGTIATVVSFHKITGDLILEEPGTGRWIADPAKTEPEPGGWMHKEGLIALG